MMKVRYSPQRNDQTLSYVFGVDSVTATLGDISETWDFAALPDGIAEAIAAELLPLCPILSAERIAGVLHLVLLRTLGPNASQAERFPSDTWEIV